MKEKPVANPFILRVIPPEAPFCNRLEDIQALSSHAANNANVVLFSPRRFGKTSLVKKIQTDLARQGFYTFYVDFFMAGSAEDIAGRMAKAIYAVLHKRESLLKKGARYLKAFKTFRPVFKPAPNEGFSLSLEPASGALSGLELLEGILTDLGEFIRKPSRRTMVVFDEFQEITELKAVNLEGLFRRHIQEHRASYFFVGSRRRILVDMFNQRKRPFFQSAIMHPLAPLPYDALTLFLMDRFSQGGKPCPESLAAMISEQTEGYPYYAQALAYHVYEVSEESVTADDIKNGFEKLMASERYGFEGIVQGFTGPQIALLKALAVDPQRRITTTEYMGRHKLSLGGIQYAQKKLVASDLIENTGDLWHVTDPVFSQWLRLYG
jgi:uncharacterized protein